MLSDGRVLETRPETEVHHQHPTPVLYIGLSNSLRVHVPNNHIIITKNFTIITIIIP